MQTIQDHPGKPMYGSSFVQSVTLVYILKEVHKNSFCSNKAGEHITWSYYAFLF